MKTRERENIRAESLFSILHMIQGMNDLKAKLNRLDELEKEDREWMRKRLMEIKYRANCITNRIDKIKTKDLTATEA